jgi:predicted Zn-ribbon and HTH transcriptional regulator
VKPRPATPPLPESHATVRAALKKALRSGLLTARELSARVSAPEKQIAGHLEHLARSLRAGGERLHVEPARCLECPFVFRKRDRLTRPSRCPVCRSEHLDGPRFTIAAR